MESSSAPEGDHDDNLPPLIKKGKVVNRPSGENDDDEDASAAEQAAPLEEVAHLSGGEEEDEPPWPAPAGVPGQEQPRTNGTTKTGDALFKRVSQVHKDLAIEEQFSPENESFQKHADALFQHLRESHQKHGPAPDIVSGKEVRLSEVGSKVEAELSTEFVQPILDKTLRLNEAREEEMRVYEKVLADTAIAERAVRMFLALEPVFGEETAAGDNSAEKVPLLGRSHDMHELAS